MTKSKDVITQIRKAIRRKFSAEEKIRIVLEGLRGKNGLTKDTLRDTTSDEVDAAKGE